MTNTIVTITIAVVFGLSIIIPILRLSFKTFKKVNKITVESKLSGEVVELDLNKKNNVDKVERFADILLGLK